MNALSTRAALSLAAALSLISAALMSLGVVHHASAQMVSSGTVFEVGASLAIGPEWQGRTP